MALERMMDGALVEEARQLDRSPQLNRSNILFSRLSVRIARQLLLLSASNSSGSASLNDPSDDLLQQELEGLRDELAAQWNSSADSDSDSDSKNRPPFGCVEGAFYALNACKMRAIRSPGHVAVTVPFYCEFERGRPHHATGNPNGEESPIQKLEEALFLLEFARPHLSMELVFVNDAIAEKKDDRDGGGSARLFQRAILEYLNQHGLEFHVQKKKDEPTEDDEEAADDDDRDLRDSSFDRLTLLDGRLGVTFTSVEREARRGSRWETAAEKRRRYENRDPLNQRLRERKGGAVLAGLEMDPLPSATAAALLGDHRRFVRCLVDGDSAHPLASFVGDAAHSILEGGNPAYLGNLRHAGTCVATMAAAATILDDNDNKESGGATATQTATATRVQNRKLFFSGLVVPFLFPELALKYSYRGTTQLPVKAFRGDVDFGRAQLFTVQPNVDLGLLAYLCGCLNDRETTVSAVTKDDDDGGADEGEAGAGGETRGSSIIIDSGPVTIRDNVASSTMTTDDLESEWTKTYGPIFTSAVALCRQFKPREFRQLPAPWLATFIENMELHHYTTLFGPQAASNADVVALFETVKNFQGAAASEADRAAVLDELRTDLDKIFGVV